MKRLFLFFGLFAMTLGAASCDITFNKKNEVPPADRNSIVLNSDKEWAKSDLTTHDVSLAASNWQLDAPDRTPWGFIRLRNATSNEMAHVSFYRKEWGSEPVSVLPSSYGKGEEARVALPEGEYNVTWDIIDGDTGTKLGSWIYRGVMVHQGRNDDAATVRISTVDGERVE